MNIEWEILPAGWQPTLLPTAAHWRLHDRRWKRRLRWSRMPTTSPGQRPWSGMSVRFCLAGVQVCRNEISRGEDQ